MNKLLISPARKVLYQENFRDNYLSEIEEMMKPIDSIIDSSTISYFVDLIHISNNIIFNFADSSTIAP